MVDAEEVAYKDLTPKERRRLLARALIRALLSAALLVVVYYWLPLDRDLDWVAGVVLVLGLSAFTVLMVWHVRSITRARAPGLRAIESLFTALPLFLLVFATVYFIMGQSAVDLVLGAADPHRRAVLHRHGVLHRRFRGHHADDRIRPGRRDDPDVRGPTGAGCRAETAPRCCAAGPEAAVGREAGRRKRRACALGGTVTRAR